MSPAMMIFPPYHTTARVVMFMASIITGMVAMTIFMAFRLDSFKSWFISLNLSSSKSSRTKDLITRTLVSASWIPELRRSSFSCILVNLGNAVRSIRAMARLKSGMTTSMTTASLAFMMNAMIRAPTNMPGARSIRRSPIMITFWICWMSLVSLVTREPVK